MNIITRWSPYRNNAFRIWRDGLNDIPLPSDLSVPSERQITRNALIATVFLLLGLTLSETAYSFISSRFVSTPTLSRETEELDKKINKLKQTTLDLEKKLSENQKINENITKILQSTKENCQKKTTSEEEDLKQCRSKIEELKNSRNAYEKNHLDCEFDLKKLEDINTDREATLKTRTESLDICEEALETLSKRKECKKECQQIIEDYLKTTS